MGEQMWDFDYYVLSLFCQSALDVNQNKSLDYNMAKKLKGLKMLRAAIKIMIGIFT